jgi:hypothetical protein
MSMVMQEASNGVVADERVSTSDQRQVVAYVLG